jgi:hypothetical protein
VTGASWRPEQRGGPPTTSDPPHIEDHEPAPGHEVVPSVTRTGDDLRALVDAFLAGCAVGRHIAEDEMARDWHEMYVKTRAVLDQPSQDEQARRRRPPTRPCYRCDGRSSCCVFLAYRARHGVRRRSPS